MINRGSNLFKFRSYETILLILSLYTVSFLSPACNGKPAIKTIYRCDDFGEGRCREKHNSDQITYSFKVPEYKTKSWRKLGYHMYFNSRETPGVRLEFNRPLTKKDRNVLNNSLKCSYRIRKGERSVMGHLEGIEIDEDGGGVWCFDYLGSMLEKYHKKYKSIDSPPDRAFFPIELELLYHSPIKIVNGSIKSKVFVQWQVED